MLFDSTLRRDLARSFGATLVVIMTIVLTMMLIRTLGQAALGRVGPQDVVLLLGYTALGHLPTMLALSLFISVVATLSRLYRDSEMTIWFVAGAPLSRFVKPILRMAWPVLVVLAILALFVWPWGNQRISDLKDRFEQRADISRVAPGQFQTSGDGQRVFFIDRDNANMGKDGSTDVTGTGTGPSSSASTGRSVFILSTHNDLESVTTARTGRLEVQGGDRYLVLDKGQRNDENMLTGEKTISRFDNYRVLAGERVLSNVDTLPSKSRGTADLMRSTNALDLGELAWRLGLIFGAANLMLLGVGLAATNPRRASNWNLLFALLSFVVYYNFIGLSQSWVSSGKTGIGAALLITHGGAFGLAAALLWWRDNGTHWRLFKRAGASL
ncbi:MAG: LPS export ABC transporter permease LptF [Pseudorhodobacter sp.]|nr:LPS export ABC transporter permease LptF [Rhizobacter sp.]